MYAKVTEEHIIFSQMELFFLHGQVVKVFLSIKAADALHPNQQCLLCFLMVIADCFPCRIVNILKRMQKCLEGRSLLFLLQRLDDLFQSFLCQDAFLIMHLQAGIFLPKDSPHGSRPCFLHR